MAYRPSLRPHDSPLPIYVVAVMAAFVLGCLIGLASLH